ncbi:uncharacterized protein LOC117555808 [Gymnodraco acuticeps]|uniref:Uncharacterized protein LOC117555808 n=1 Tax=Gymnodraco acuticeps TaxID=8218 RepID=A0A6P8VJI4_GYMAC|nr:uncharacterized protein LOC117555808 [Gymnodraco acuticeps]
MSDDPRTSADAETLLKSLKASHSGKLGACTRKMNEMKALLVEDGNVEHVNEALEMFKLNINDLCSVHGSVQQLLSEEEREEDHVDWFEPKMTHFEYCMKDVDVWKREKIAQSKIHPHDSISNVSHKSRSSKTSSVSSACRRASAEKAALLARAAGLKGKHALLLQLEQMELDTEIAASAAKIKVLQSIDVEEKMEDQIQDGMNAYLEESKEKSTDTLDPEISAMEFMPLGAVPKTPLQRTVINLRSPQQPTIQFRPFKTPTMHSSTQRNETHDNLDTVIQRQRDIADLIIMQQKLTLLPTMEIKVFDGDPLEYQSFMRAFEHLIEDKTASSHDRLYFLDQYTSGQPKDLVRSCLHMDTQRGYTEAKKLLKEHFGDEIKVTSAYLEKAMNWTSIRPDDGKALQAYAMYLRGCCNAMQDLKYMDELDIPSNLRSIISKLPYKLREKWRTVAYEILQRTKERARFRDLVELMEKQAKILLDPLFGDIQDRHISSPRMATRSQPMSHRTPKSRGSSFTTIIAAACDQESSVAPSNSHKGAVLPLLATFVKASTC